MSAIRWQHMGGKLMIRECRLRLWIFIVCLLVLYCGETTVWASTEDAAKCKAAAEKGQGSSAIEACTLQITSDASDLESVFWRGVAYYKRGFSSKDDYRSALEDFNRVLAVYPNDMQALENRASCYMELKRYEEAITDANEIIAADRTALGALMVRGKAYWWISRYDDAISDYTAAIALNPRSEDTKFSAYSTRASCHRFLKNYERALADYTIALGIKPSYQHVAGYIADCLNKLGRKNEAIAAWNNAIAIIDRDPSRAKDPYYIKEKATAQAEIAKLRK